MFPPRYRLIVARSIGTKFTVALGIAIAAAGFFYFARIAAVDVTYAKFVIPMCITSLGIGFTMAPATNSVMGSIPVSQSGVGSAMNSTMRQIGGALGVAVLGTILNSTYLTKINAAPWPAQLPSQALDAIRNSIQEAHIVAQKIPYPQYSKMIIDQSNQAFTSGATHALVVAGIIMAVTAVLTLFILPSRVRPPREEN